MKVNQNMQEVQDLDFGRLNDINKPYQMLQVCMHKMMHKKMHMHKMIPKMILKISRTIADLEGKENIEAKHLMEAIRYRTVDQKYWGQWGQRREDENRIREI